VLIDDKAHRQGAGAPGESLERRLAAEPDVVLLRGDEDEIFGVGAGDERLRVGRCVAVVVGKADAAGDRDAGRCQRGEELFRIADAAEGQYFAASQRGEAVAVGLEPAVEYRNIAAPRGIDGRRRAAGGPDYDQRLGAGDLGVKRRPPSIMRMVRFLASDGF